MASLRLADPVCSPGLRIVLQKDSLRRFHTECGVLLPSALAEYMLKRWRALASALLQRPTDKVMRDESREKLARWGGVKSESPSELSTCYQSPEMVIHKNEIMGRLCIDAEAREGIVVSALEEDDGSQYYVFLCNFANMWWTDKQARTWFPRDLRVCIREPKVTLNQDGVACLELLNPAAVVIRGMGSVSDEGCTLKLAATALHNHEFIRAAYLFTKCLENKDEKRYLEALSGRCDAWLQAGLYENALVDAQAGLQSYDQGPASMKRKGRSLLGLQEYVAALECFEVISGNDEETVEYVNRCHKLVENSVHGVFDLEDYYLSSECRSCTPECGEYVGPVTIAMAPDGKGRGLFATRELKAGDVIFHCNPLAALFDRKRIPAEDDLIAQMVRNCMASSRSLQQLVSLVDSDDIPDMELFQPNSNWFMKHGANKSEDVVDIPACARKTSVNYGYKFERMIGPEREREYLSGLWVLTAFANHSCAPSATQKAVGNGSLVRAGRDLRVGDEITLAYLDPFVPWDVRSRQTWTRWGFKCACERCKFEAELHERNPGLFKVGAKMEKLLEEASNLDLFELSEIACKVEKEISRWQGPEAVKHKHWIRASYYKAYEVYLLNRVEFEKFLVRQAPPPWETVMEALHFTAPGYEGLLPLLLLLGQHCENRGVKEDLIRRECMSSFGNLTPGAVKSIVRGETAAAISNLQIL